MARILLMAEAEEERLKMMHKLRNRQLRDESQPMLLPELTFVNTFRLSKRDFTTLCKDLLPFLSRAQRKTAIKPAIKILAALQFYGSGSYQKDVGNDFSLGLSQTSVSDCLTEVTEALNHPQIIKKYIYFPKTVDERNATARRFNNLYGFPNVMGCIDGTHVAIIRPTNYEEAYFNNKMYHSLNVMMVCNADLRILHVDASFGGATHDSHIWNVSDVKPGMKKLHDMGQIFWFLSDSAYAQRPWLMTPILNAQPSSPEEHYNKLHERTMNVMERCFGILKTRFRCLLANRTLHYTPEKAGKIVNACVVLHNLVNNNNIEIDEEALRQDRALQPAHIPYVPLNSTSGSCPMRQSIVNRLQNTHQHND